LKRSKSSASRRVAVLLSGHLRSMSGNAELIRALAINGIEVDFFCHTWTKRDMASETWRVPEHGSEEYSKAEDLQKLLPKSFLIEDQRVVVPPVAVTKAIARLDAAARGPALGFWFQLYGITKVYRLCEEYALGNGFEYAAIVRWRYDLISENLSEILADLIRAIGNKDIIIASHAWGWAGGLFSDTYFVSPAALLPKILENSQAELIAYSCSHNSQLRFIPELAFSSAIRVTRSRLRCSKSNLSLVRKNGFFERVNSLPTERESNWSQVRAYWSTSCTGNDIRGYFDSAPSRCYQVKMWQRHAVLPYRTLTFIKARLLIERLIAIVRLTAKRFLAFF
jgi:hypothetical protein